ncbi:MAG: hypothetical protein QOI55_2240 [Actinomycetota bacterium]|nr:hypothetical protein [Actinomycetota bacterium]
MSDPRSHLALSFRLHGAAARHSGSAFYGDLCELLAQDAERDGVVVGAMGEHATAPFDDAYNLRLLGGLHRMVLTGEAPALRAHYPSTGGDGDAEAAWRLIEPILRAPPPAVLDALARGCQTNEVGRAAPLASGFAVVGARTGLPLRLLELGSSAGLNLRLDRYYYESGTQAWGDSSSAVRFVDDWDGGAPPFAPATEVASRRGCDLAPIDPNAPGTDITLLSFVWPGQSLRFERLRAALDIARDVPVDIDTAPADAWLAAQLASPIRGVATIVFHSIVWGYFSTETRNRVTATLAEAGGRATDDAPLAWVRLEPAPKMIHAELRCTTWPGGDEQLLATAGFHAGRVTWLA